MEQSIICTFIYLLDIFFLQIEIKESSIEIVMPFAVDVLLLNQSSLFSITDSVYGSLQCIYMIPPFKQAVLATFH